MKTLHFLKKLLKKGGEVQMRRSLIVIAVSLLVIVPALALADIALDVKAGIVGGKELKGPDIFTCKGYMVPDGIIDAKDFAAACTAYSSKTSIDFGTLSHQLKDTAGVVTGDAGCFYGENYFIVLLYPNAWGGATYTLKQTTVIGDTNVRDAMLFTPVYSPADLQMWPGETTPTHPQGNMTQSEIGWNPQVSGTKPISGLATNTLTVFKSNRGRIVEAQYGIPPTQKGGAPWVTNWKAIPVDKAAGSYTAKITFTLTD